MEDIIIIGGGPAGLSAGIYLSRAGYKPTIFAGFPPGGQLMLTSEVENFPGNLGIHGPELVAVMRKQAQQFGARIIDANVKEVSKSTTDQSVIIKTGDENVGILRSRALLVATGASALWLGIESEQRYRGKGVSACATCDGFFFRGREVAVIGGGDSALEEAIFLTKFVSKVTLIHRRNTLKGSRIMQERVLNNQKIQVLLDTSVVEIVGDEKVKAIITKNDKGVEQKIQLDGVFVAIGHRPDTDFLAQSGILRDEMGYILTQGRIAELMYMRKTVPHIDEELLEVMHRRQYLQSETTVTGVFAAGDCVDRLYRQASTAAGFGVSSSLDIEKFLSNL
jgi:thioredoxin reductase (NADPH)